jgi:shikimate kinase
MIIEFTGVPCCGKSDISHELSKLLRDKGYSVCENQYKVSHGKNTIIRVLTKFSSCLIYSLKHPKNSLHYYRVLGSKRLWVNYIYLLSHKCKSDICILEQGYLQLIGSFFDGIETDVEKMAMLFEKIIPQTDILQVFVSVSRETVLKRANIREDKPFFMRTKNLTTALENVFSAEEKLKQIWCQNKGETMLITVSNEKDNSQHETAKSIFDIVKQKEIL